MPNKRRGPGDHAGSDTVRELGALLRSGTPVQALIGAGLSASAGLPTWTGLLEELAPLPRLKTGDRSTQEHLRLRDARADQDLPWRVQLLEDTPEARASVRAKLKERFFVASAPSSPALESVVRIPFQHILTTNYDNLLDLTHARLKLERGFVVLRWEVAAERVKFINALGRSQPERFYVHLHGRADDPERCVLSEEDYRERYLRSQTLSRHLYAWFASQTVVFIGFSLTDPDFIAILREVSALGGGSPRHYAILPRPEQGEAGLSKYLLGKYGALPLLYPNESGKHDGLAMVLADIERLAKDASDDWAFVDLNTRRADGLPNDPDDPNAGHFGGSADSDGFILRLTHVAGWDDDWVSLELEVSTRDGRPPTVPVAFYIHPTFPESVIRVPPSSQPCTIRLTAWGVFVVGAVVGPARTLLELDLATDPRIPQAVRNR
jgi:hypothetical protein